MHRPGRRACCRGARSRAGSSPATARGEGERLTTRAGTDPFGDSLYVPTSTSTVVDRVSEVAAERGVPAAQVALAWLLGRPGRDGADRRRDEGRRTSRTRSPPQALELTADEVARLEEPYVPHAVSGHE